MIWTLIVAGFALAGALVGAAVFMLGYHMGSRP